MKGKLYPLKNGVIVTEEDIKYIVTTALEGGIGYWATVSRPQWAAKPSGIPVSTYTADLLITGDAVYFEDAETYAGLGCLTFDKLLSGIEMTLSDGHYELRKGPGIDIGAIDSFAADAIFQYALFGEIIYS